MLSKQIIILLFSTLSFGIGFGQQESNELDPTFSTFKGMTYEMPIIDVKKGNLTKRGIQLSYGKNIYDYPQLGEIELEEINIPNTTIGYGVFPGVERTTRFCMILHSTLDVKKDAFYEFSLRSDDGSILWIDGAEVVNNDGGHKMTLKQDTFFLAAGTYPAKLWYFQGHVDKFGLELNVKPVPRPSIEKTLTSVKTLELNSTLLFDTDAYTLNEKGKKEFSELIDSIGTMNFSKVTIIGHTDDVGTESYNRQLSQKRAETVAYLFRKKFKEQGLEIKAIGKGESDPKVKGTDRASRLQNRRVEIIISN